MHKGTRNAARPAVQVLVRAERRKINVPVMHVQGHIASGVRQVNAHLGTHRMARCRDAWDVKQLASVVLHARPQHKGKGVTCTRDRRQDVFMPDGVLTLPRRHQDEILRWGEPVRQQL